MRKFLTLYFLAFLAGLLVFCTGARGQSMEKQAAMLLKSEGFEEIRVMQQNTMVVCTIERGLARSPDADFRRALAVLKGVYPPGSSFQIILLEQGQAVYSLPPKGDVTWADLNFFKSIKKEAVVRPVHSGFTLVVYPQVTLQNMYFDQIYEKQFNIAPALHYSGWKGMLLTGQVIFPVVNELNYRDNSIRPGFVTFSQSFRLPNLNRLKLTVGNFNNDRYGADLKWKKNFEGSPWSLGLNLGLTGRSVFYDQYWNHTASDRIKFLAKE